MHRHHVLQRTFIFTLLFWAAFLISPAAMADWTDARCDVYPGGEDHASASIPCVFGQRQGYITINRSDGVSHDLSPQDDAPGHFRDANGRDVYRQSDLGKAGQIFRFADESVYMFWDTAGLPGNSDEDNYAAPYSTAKFDATTRLPCSLQGHVTIGNDGCAAGINRGPKSGQAVIAIMRSDGVERILQFDGDSVISPGKGKIHAQWQSDEWTITIDDIESYRIPVAAIDGG
jgi:hypothetical protein